ncbi:MAG: hypothetical protein IBX47_09615 [Desulfuromonadales bacterium]|nr:hypothetical protein [Desulfuromonadales bacterium]
MFANDSLLLSAPVFDEEFRGISDRLHGVDGVVGDLIWLACDSRARGFLIGASSGRTTLAGEGLQHQDGQSHLLAMAPTKIKAYDPAFAYELAFIIHEGLTRMYCSQEDWI